MEKIYLGIVLTGLLLLLACQGTTPRESQSLLVSGSGTASPVSQTETVPASKTVGLVMKTLTNPFFVEMEKGARRAEAELGIRLIVKTGSQETSIDQQISIVEELIQSKVDAIVIAPGSSTELIPVLKKAREAGIPIINIDNRLDPALSKEKGLVDVPFISVDNEKGAYLSAKYISGQITAPTQVAILEGIRGATNAEDRKKGALRAFGENKNIQVVATETANWKIDEAHDVTAKLYQTNPNLRAIFCANDMMALGTLKYLDEAGQHGVLVAAFDALDEAKRAILDGKLAVTIDQQAAEQGYTGVQYAMRALKGEKLPLETLVDVKVITLKDLK